MWKPIEYTNDDSGFSVCMLDTEHNLHFWVDLWVTEEHDIECDWNQYIFSLEDEEDQLRMQIQDDCDNFIEATGEAVCFLEMQGVIYQDEQGNWFNKD